jgi:hypothetical protein
MPALQSLANNLRRRDNQVAECTSKKDFSAWAMKAREP